MAHLFDEQHDDAWRYERFITTIQQKAGISWGEAERAAQATLLTLGERISEGQARDVAQDLPGELREWLLSRVGHPEPFGAVEFVRRVAEREGTKLEAAEEHVRAVFIALSRLVRGNELEELCSELPKDYEGLTGQKGRRPLDAMPTATLSESVFIDRIEGRAGLDRERAERAADAVLETLAERITGGEVDELAGAVPDELRPALERGKAHTGGKARRMSLDEFIDRVAEREVDGADVSTEDALDHTRAVFRTLREALPHKTLTHLLGELPRSYAETLLPA